MKRVLIAVGLVAAICAAVIAVKPEILLWMGFTRAAELCGCDLTSTIRNPSLHNIAEPAAALPPGVEKKEYGDAVISESQEKDGARVKTVLFKDLLVDRIYPSMRGPSKLAGVVLGKPEESTLWIRSYRAEVLDGKSGKASQEYMCHTNMNEVGVQGSAAQDFNSQRFLISQGQTEVEFPEGYALRVPNAPDKQFEIFAMVLNNNDEKINRKLDFKASVKYYGDQQAQKMKLKPLFMTGCQIFALTDPSQAKPGETVVKPATPDSVIDIPRDGRKGCGHWMVPPGRQVVKTDVSSALPWDMNVHYLFMHLHPYAESLELRDMTENKTLWKGKVKNFPDPKRAVLLSTDFYSSSKGFAMHKDHKYELISTYNNPTSHDVDAMASLWMYVSVPD